MKITFVAFIVFLVLENNNTSNAQQTPRCKAVETDSLLIGGNETYYVGDREEFSCKENFILQGFNSSICSPDGWILQGTCQPQQAPSNPHNLRPGEIVAIVFSVVLLVILVMGCFLFWLPYY